MTQKYQVRDGNRQLSFEGELLSSVSSRKDGSARWTELELYKTSSGKYILAKVGRSMVTHMPGCFEVRGELPRFQEKSPGDDPDHGYSYHDCVPETYNFTELLVEHDLFSTVITDSPKSVVDSLYRRRGRERSITRIAIKLLEEAGLIDSAIMDAYSFEEIS